MSNKRNAPAVASGDTTAASIESDALHREAIPFSTISPSGKKVKTDDTLAELPKVQRREGAISWDDYFMAVSYLSAMRSKDPSTQVGATVVNKANQIVGVGYNGFPRGISNDELPWSREAARELDRKYFYIVHAEVNAVLNKNDSSLHDCTIYVALFPCNECAKIIIQSGIKEVVYLSDKYKDTESMMASRRMMVMAGLKLRQHVPAQRSITIDFGAIPREVEEVVEVANKELPVTAPPAPPASTSSSSN